MAADHLDPCLPVRQQEGGRLVKLICSIFFIEEGIKNMRLQIIW